MLTLSKVIFFAVLVFSFTGFLSPPFALTTGILFGLCFTHPFAAGARAAARILLQICVVALGFGVNLQEVMKAGRSGFVYTALGISFALIVGLGIGRFLQVQGNASFLITSGTAICGGSAIAAVGPILHASDEEMAVSLATVFILNSVALLLFPAIGMALRMTQAQFGLWSALAIHDTSSVVGAASKYGQQALVVGTTVKLARALWIVPLSLATAAVRHTKSRIRFPWFILFFCVAAVLNAYVSAIAHIANSLFAAGRLGLVATLFLIGTSISGASVKQVGWRPMLQGVALWIAVGATSLYFIRNGTISF